MELIKPGSKIPFTRYRYIAIGISTVVNLLVLVLLFTKGPLLGVDFAGGTMVQLKFTKPVSIPEIRNALGDLGAGDTVIQDFGQEGSNEFLVRLERTSVQLGELGEQVKARLAKQFGSDGFEVRRIESVGPKVGDELRSEGPVGHRRDGHDGDLHLDSFWLRLRRDSVCGAVIALVHDVLVTVGALMLANYEFDLTVIAALLTIVGFSVNDTVVICDRIRENLRKIKRESLETIINTSINETLSRTIITTGTAILVLLALFLLGGGVIQPFAFALLVGFFSGVYSTIFIASPVVLLWEKRAVAKKQ